MNHGRAPPSLPAVSTISKMVLSPGSGSSPGVASMQQLSPPPHARTAVAVQATAEVGAYRSKSTTRYGREKGAKSLIDLAP